MTLEQLMLETGRQMQLLTLYLVAAVAMAATVFYTLLAIFVTGLRGKSNCMLYAYRAYRRGAFVMVRKTQWGRVWRWPHFRWSDDGATWWEFVPFARKRRRVIPPLLFSGEVRRWVPLVLVWLLLWAQPVRAAYALGNTATCGGGSCTTAGIDTSTSGGVATDVLVVAVGYFSSSETITDNKSNTWHCTDQPGSASSIRLCYTSKGGDPGTFSVGAGHTVTAGASGFPGLAFGAFSGTLLSGEPKENASGTTSSGTTSIQPGSITPTGTDLFVVALGNSCGNNAFPGTITFGSSFTQAVSQAWSSGTNCSASFGYKGSGTAENPSLSWSTGSDNGRVEMFAFKPDGGGGGGATSHPCGTLLLLGVGCEAQP